MSERAKTSNLLIGLALVLALLALLQMGAAFADDGWTLQAFDTGSSSYWGPFMTLCPAALLLAALGVLLGMR